MKNSNNRITLMAVVLFWGLLFLAAVNNQATAVETTSVTVTTGSEFEDETDNYSAKILVPQFENMADTELQFALNHFFQATANGLIDTYNADLEWLKTLEEGDKPHFTVEYNYKTVTDTDDVLSIQVYYFSAAGSSNFAASYYNFDKKTNELITLSSLFGKNEDYMTILTDYVTSEMLRQNESGEGGYWLGNTFGEANTDEMMQQAFDLIEENHQYYLNEDGKLVIIFNKYDVAPGVYGSPEFIIPDEVMAEILK